MKQFLLLMAVIGLATTGCAQNRLVGPQTRGAGAGLRVGASQAHPPRTAQNKTGKNQFKLAMFGGRDCDEGCCEADCGPDSYCDCTAAGCDGGCDDACCGSGCCGPDGCSWDDGNCGAGRGAAGCSACGGRGCGLCSRLAGRCNPHAGGYPEAQNFNPSPPTGQVAYPYYTVRGPRDFLRNNPPSIGPY